MFAVESARDILSTVDTQARLWSEDGGSGQTINVDFIQFHQVLAFMPLGMFTALFRPLPGEVLNLFGVLAGLENFLLLILFFRAFRGMRRRELNNPLILWAILFVLSWAGVYGLISYQSFGTAVRFRLQILPVLLCLLLYLGRRRQIVKKPIS